MKNYLLLGALVFSCLAPACGGDDAADDGKSGDGTCGKVAACGGNLVGEWTVDESCIGGGVGAMSCPEATIDSSGLNLVGSFSYKADGTFTSSGTTSGSIIITLPAKCLAQPGGVTVTCQQITDSSKDSDTPLDCKDAAAGGCSCSHALKSNTSTDSGTYTTSGTTVSTTSAGEMTPSSNEYCVSGDYLHIVFTGGADGAGPTGGIVMSRK